MTTETIAAGATPVGYGGIGIIRVSGHLVEKIAQYVDEKMREIDRNQTLKSTTRVAILAALNIAEELFQERIYRNKLLDQLDKESKKLNNELTEVLGEQD